MRGDQGQPIAWDPAIDLEQSDVDRYWDSMFADGDAVVFKDGQEPTTFSITPLTSRQQVALAGVMNGEQRTRYGLRCAVTGHRNYSVERDDGTVYVPEQPERKKEGALGELSSEKWLDQMNLHRDDRAGLMLMIDHITEPPVPLSRP